MSSENTHISKLDYVSFQLLLHLEAVLFQVRGGVIWPRRRDTANFRVGVPSGHSAARGIRRSARRTSRLRQDSCNIQRWKRDACRHKYAARKTYLTSAPRGTIFHYRRLRKRCLADSVRSLRILSRAIAVKRVRRVLRR